MVQNGKKIVFSLLILAVLAFLTGDVFAAVNNGDVAYLYNRASKIDHKVISVFDELGLKTDVINENNLPSNFSKYKLIFVDDENYRKVSQIPIGDKPSIIANLFNGRSWGIVDNDGVSALASNSPLNVKKSADIIQVYTDAFFIKTGSTLAIPYYYLGDENKVPGAMSVARTFTGSDDGTGDIGDVISYINASTRLLNGKMSNSKICFFGIIESDFWTPEARQMFKDCAGFVGSACDKDNDCPADSLSGTFCSNNKVSITNISYTCENPGKINSECKVKQENITAQECTDFCSGGVCKNFVCKTNSDCGANINGSNLCIGKNVTKNVTSFICNSPTTPLSFCSNSTSTNIIEQCTDTCSNGMCQKIICTKDSDCDDKANKTMDICNNPGTFNSSCSNIPILCFNNGDCNDNNLSTADICNNPGTTSSFCTNPPIVIACRQNSDCADNNPLTFDECVNPGTVVSQCRNTPINCASDVDCGFTGFTGNEFCSANDVFKNFQNATCTNPGTLLSFCADSIEQKLINQCPFACSSGTCIRCDSNLDCNDNNNSTADICNNPGTIQSSCGNDIIVCSSNSDCGVDGFVGSDYCTTNNVTRNFQTFTCNNPGTAQSSCSSNVTQNFVQECSGICSDGQCADRTLSCSLINGNCSSGSTQVLRLSSLQNAHAALNDSIYRYALCCSSNSGLSNSCSGNFVSPVLLSSLTNAHVAKNNVNSSYSVPACLASNSGTVSCSYRASCLSNETCLISIAGADNSHASQCGNYSTQVCCAIQ